MKPGGGTGKATSYVMEKHTAMILIGVQNVGSCWVLLGVYKMLHKLGNNAYPPGKKPGGPIHQSKSTFFQGDSEKSKYPDKRKMSPHIA